jgi:hypothetical protein
MATIFISTPVQSFSNPQVHRLKFTIGLFLVWRPDTVVISMIPTFFNPFAIFFLQDWGITYQCAANPSDAFAMLTSSIVTLSYFMFFSKNHVTIIDTNVT